MTPTARRQLLACIALPVVGLLALWQYPVVVGFPPAAAPSHALRLAFRHSVHSTSDSSTRPANDLRFVRIQIAVMEFAPGEAVALLDEIGGPGSKSAAQLNALAAKLAAYGEMIRERYWLTSDGENGASILGWAQVRLVRRETHGNLTDYLEYWDFAEAAATLELRA